MVPGHSEWKRNLLLVGFMGAGKTTLGGILSKRCRLDFVDTDQLLTEQFGLSVADIFSRHGENAFRVAETELLRNLAARCRHSVIATGGGMVLKDENWRAMRQIGPVVFLRADEQELVDRLSSATGRPLADDSDREAILERYRQRLPCYLRADLVVETKNQAPLEVVDAILGGLERVNPKWLF